MRPSLTLPSGKSFTVTGATTDSSGVTVTQDAAGVGKQNYITNMTISISGGVTKLAILTDGAGGATLWSIRFRGLHKFRFKVPIITSANTAAVLNIASGATNTEASMSGFSA